MQFNLASDHDTFNLTPNSGRFEVDLFHGRRGPDGPVGPQGPGIGDAITAEGLRRAATYVLPALQAGTARVVSMGDSKTEGTSIGSLSQRWFDQVVAELRARYGVGGDQGVGYIPAGYATAWTTDLADHRPTLSDGVTTVGYEGGFGNRAASLSAAGHSVTWKPETCNRVRVWYTKGNLVYQAGQAEVLVDGTVVGTLSGSGPAVTSGNYTEYTVTPGLHTVQVRWKDSAGSYAFRVEGVEFRTATTGVMQWDGAHSGFRTDHYAIGNVGVGATESDTRHWECVQAVDPHLIMVGLGANDMASLSVGEWKQNVKTIAERVQTYAPKAGLLWVMSTAKATAVEMTKRAQFEAALREVLLPFPNASIVYEASLYQLVDGPDADLLNVWTDESGGIHPNAKGHAAIARAVIDALLFGEPTEVEATLRQLSGYVARTVTGAVTINAIEAGTWALDLTGDTTLTIAGSNGSTVVLDVVLGGHLLTIVDGPEVAQDGKIAVNKSRGVWTGGAGGSSQIAVTPTAPTWKDDPDAGENAYTIPTKAGVAYKVGGVLKAAGTYPAAGGTSVTVTAEITDPDRYYLSEQAYTSWSHTFPVSSLTLIGSLNLSTVADGTDISTLKLQPAGIALTTGGSGVAQAGFTGGKWGFHTSTGVTSARVSASLPALTKYRVTSGYSMTSPNDNSSVGVTVSGYGSATIRNGVLSVNGNTNFTWTTVVNPAGWVAPSTGVLSVEWDVSQAGVTVATARIDGVIRGQIKSTDSGAHNMNSSTDLAVQAWNGSTATLTGTLKVESVA